MAIRRQAPSLSEADYAVYVDDLIRFELVDIEQACLRIGRAERDPRETAFPPVATILSHVRSIRNAREDKEQQAARDAEEEEARRSIEAGDGRYVRFDFGEMVRTIIEKRSLNPEYKRRA